MVRQALTRAQIGWECHIEDCQADGELFVYYFDDERAEQLSEGTLVCLNHFRAWMTDMVLQMTDIPPTVHHVIVSRP